MWIAIAIDWTHHRIHLMTRTCHIVNRTRIENNDCLSTNVAIVATDATDATVVAAADAVDDDGAVALADADVAVVAWHVEKPIYEAAAADWTSTMMNYYL